MQPAPREFSLAEYRETFSPPMLDVTETAEEMVGLWAYADQVIVDNYDDPDSWNWRVAHIYESRSGMFQHIYIPVPHVDTYIVVILDKPARAVMGHIIGPSLPPPRVSTRWRLTFHWSGPGHRRGPCLGRPRDMMPAKTRHSSASVRPLVESGRHWNYRRMPLPEDFYVNEAWIVFRLNSAPLLTEQDGALNCVALMDAASCFILGSELIPASASQPTQLEFRRLLKTAKRHEQQLPKTLFVSCESASDVITREASRQKIDVVSVPESELHIFIGEARQGFDEMIQGGRGVV